MSVSISMEPTGEHSVVQSMRDRGHNSAQSSLRITPELVRINGELGMLIQSLPYGEYRKLAGMLMLLRLQEEHGPREEKRAPPPPKDRIPTFVFVEKAHQPEVPEEKQTRMTTRMDRLIELVVEKSPDKDMQKMKRLLEERSQFDEDDIMAQLLLLTRLYYAKGVNMLNPDDGSAMIELRDDKDMVVSTQGGDPIIAVRKVDGKAIAQYPDERGIWNEIELEDGRTYRFGRAAENFTVKNCEGGLQQTLPNVTVVQGMMKGTVSRAGMGVEVRDEKVAFYDCASKNNMSFSWQKFAPNAREGTVRLRESISRYNSEAIQDKNGVSQLGSSVVLDSEAIKGELAKVR